MRTCSCLLAAMLGSVVSFACCVGCGGPQATSPTTTATNKPATETPAEKPAATEDQPADDPTTADVKLGEGWGSFKGRFVVEGAPKPQKTEITKDEAYCGKFNLVDPSIAVSESGGLANVVLTLYLARGEKAPTPHESYVETAEGEVVLDNLHCSFVPHVTLLRTSQTLLLKNSDPVPVAHNAAIAADRAINPILPPGAAIKERFEKDERLPAKVSCAIHPWMNGWIVIKDSPYMAVSDKDGNFEIKNLPAGKWTFQVWHERPGYVKGGTIDGKPVAWERGRVEVPIKAGATFDLGEVKIAADTLK